MSETIRQRIVTTPTNALTVTVYASQVCSGVAYLVGAGKAKAMTEMFGPVVADVWALALLLSALLALVAVFTVKDNVSRALAAEMGGATALGVMSLLYELTLLASNGPLAVVTTQTYAIAIGVGCMVRAWQIFRERAGVLGKDG